MTPNQYRYKCPTEGCEIDSILVNVHEDVIEYFGFCCPFCRDHMVRDDTYQSERDIEQLKKAIVEVLDTGFESSERDLMLVMDRIDAWEKGELRQVKE